MTTCRDIITRALRKARVYGAGQVPSSEDMEDGMAELQSLYEAWGSGGMFGRLSDIIAEDDYEANPGERVTAAAGVVVTLVTPDEEEDKPPFDIGFAEVVQDGFVTRSLYENGAWVTISDLTLDSVAPLANRGQGGLAACLAINLADEFGGSVGPAIVRQAGSFRMALATKHGSDAKRTAPEYF